MIKENNTLTKTRILIAHNKIHDDFGFVEKIKQENNLDKINLSMPELNYTNNLSKEEYFEILCQNGLKARYGDNISKDIINRYEKEKSDILKLGFVDTFLHYKALIDWAKSNNIMFYTCRGSALGSLICYILEITNIDPIKYNLVFERFINTHRLSYRPEIEFDVETSKKDELIEYIIKKYREENIVITYELSYPLFEVKKQKTVPLKTIIYISNESLKNTLLLGKLYNDTYISFEEKDVFEKSGCLKITINSSDILGKLKEYDTDNKHISSKFCEESIENNDFIKNTFSKEGLKLLKQIKPRNIEELTALCSLDRPGPIYSGMAEKYINAKNSGEVEYYSETIKPILEETYGEIIYQEQIIQILNLIGGFSFDEADIIRRKMSKREPIDKYKEMYLENASKNNEINYQIAQELWDKMQSVSIYCFMKAHATSYSLLLNSYLSVK